MQVDNKLLDDLARVAAGAAGAVTGIREEVEAQMRQRMERLLARMDVVSREEFEVVRELATNARREQETLAKKVAELEQRLSSPGGPASRKSATTTTKKTAAPKSRKPSKKTAAAHGPENGDNKPD